MHHKSFIYFWPLICRMMKHRQAHVRVHEFPHQSVCVDRGLWRAEPKPGLIPHGQTRPKTDFTGLCLTMSRLEGDTALCGPDLCLDVGALWMLSGCWVKNTSCCWMHIQDAHTEIPEPGPAADRQTETKGLKSNKHLHMEALTRAVPRNVTVWTKALVMPHKMAPIKAFGRAQQIYCI